MSGATTNGQALADHVFATAVAQNAAFRAGMRFGAPATSPLTKEELGHMLALLLQQSIALRTEDQFNDRALNLSCLKKVNSLLDAS